MRSWIPAVGVALLASACGFHPAGDVGDIDAPVDDDGRAIDAAASDGPIIDAAAIDAAAIDARAIDATVIDARPIDAAPQCPAGYTITSGGARYAFRAGPANVTTASTSCTADLPGHTHLATFEGNDLDAVLTALGTSNSSTVYVGARCDDLIDCDAEGNWTWLIGGPVVSTALWQQGEPSGDLPFSFAERQSGTWELVSSAGMIGRGYLCECDP